MSHSDNSNIDLSSTRCLNFSMCRDEIHIGKEDSLVDDDSGIFRVPSDKYLSYYTAMEHFEDLVDSDSDDSSGNCSRPFHSVTEISQISLTCVFEENNNMQNFPLDDQSIAIEGLLASDSSNFSNDSQSLYAVENSQISLVCANGERQFDDTPSILVPSPLCGTSQPIQCPSQALDRDSDSCSSPVQCVGESSADTTPKIRDGISQHATAIFRPRPLTPLQSALSQIIRSPLPPSAGSAHTAIIFANHCLVGSYERRWLCQARRQSRVNYTVSRDLLQIASSMSSISSRSITPTALHKSLSCVSITSSETSETLKWGTRLLDDISESSSLEKLRALRIKCYRERCMSILKESVRQSTHVNTKPETIRKKDKYRTSKWIRDTVKWRAQRLKSADKSCKETIINDNSCEKENNNTEEQRPRKHNTSKWIQDTVKRRAQQRQRLLENKSLNK